MMESMAEFAFLQSSIHELWARRYASTLGNGMRYIPTDCFETFPIPKLSDELYQAGEAYWNARSELSIRSQIGLYDIYKMFHNPKNNDSEIIVLRELHRKIDNLVLDGYICGPINLSHGFYNVSQSGKEKIRYSICPNDHEVVIKLLMQLNRKTVLNKNTYERKISGKSQSYTSDLPFQASLLDEDDLASTSQLERKENNSWGTVPIDQILAWLEAHERWFSKTAILNGSGADPEAWQAVIAELLEDGFIERIGDNDEARYRAKP